MFPMQEKWSGSNSANGQTYFAMQTRRQELTERLTLQRHLSKGTGLLNSLVRG